MGEYQIILYILAAIVYFLWQSNKKSEKGNEPFRQVSPDPVSEKPVDSWLELPDDALEENSSVTGFCDTSRLEQEERITNPAISR